MLDPVTQEILTNALYGIAEEMAMVEYRSSFSPIIREMLDFNCGVFDERGRMVAHSEQIPAQLGLMQFALQAALAKWGDDIAPGDAIITNHPYMGGTHTPDLQVFQPVYVDGAVVGWTGSIAHHIDIGGQFPGTESAQTTELFQEGLIFPAIKLVERGQRVRAIYDLVAANVRDPNATLGDLDAQLAACSRGGERLVALCGRHGADTVSRAMHDLLEQTAARARELFASWPARIVEVEGFQDDGGFEGTPPVRISLGLSVRDSELHVDFSGTSDQVRSGVNVPIASTHAAVYFAVRCFAGRSGILQNDGLARVIHLHIPEGSLLNPRFPAALSARHLAVQRTADLMVAALSELLPESAIAASHVSFPAFVFQAVDPRSGQLTLLADIIGGGGGARRDADGEHAIDTYTSNCAILPAEVAELEYPFRVECSELADGSGGSGRRRGGLGIRRDYRLLGDAGDGMYYVEQHDPRFSPAGREGGGSGAPSSVRLQREGVWRDLPSKGYLTLQRNDVVSFVSAGGGGFGATVRSHAAGATGDGLERKPE